MFEMLFVPFLLFVVASSAHLSLSLSRIVLPVAFFHYHCIKLTGPNRLIHFLLHLQRFLIYLVNMNNQESQPPPDGKNWDKVASSYKSNGISRLTSLHATDLVGATLQQIRSSKTILEIGCGTGAFGLAYLNFFPNGIPGQTLIMSDLSPAMVDEARNTLKNLSSDVQTKFVFQVEDGCKLEGIQDKSIDMVVSVFGIFLIPDREATIAAVERVLADNKGVLASASWTNTGMNESLQQVSRIEIICVSCLDASACVLTTSMLLTKWFRGPKAGFGANLQDSVLFAMASLNHGEIMEVPWKDWIEPENIQKAVLKKFANVQVFRAIHSTTFPSAQALWMIVVGSSPYFNLEEMNAQLVESAKQKFIDHVGGGDGTSPVLMQGASNIAVAFKA
jgi:ubiquinone/menaquinone biosynthesis C-methylase UbiE